MYGDKELPLLPHLRVIDQINLNRDLFVCSYVAVGLREEGQHLVLCIKR